MGRMSASMKVEQTEKLRADMRYCMISTSSIEWCLANAKGQPLNFISEFFALEADRRHKARIANIVRSAGFPTIKSLKESHGKYQSGFLTALTNCLPFIGELESLQSFFPVSIRWP